MTEPSKHAIEAAKKMLQLRPEPHPNGNYIAGDAIYTQEAIDAATADLREENERLRDAIGRISEQWKWWREDEYSNCITVVEYAIHDAVDLAYGKPIEEGDQ